ncbi:MAG TPA: hypothetical protein VE935_17450 [Burkholderiales bacterium]|jgi:hypothetical protein|nr:hypothetical protein [Burkholderiales bacterium]
MRAAVRVAAVVAVVFGAVTVFAGGNVLFGSGAKAAGNYVPFVVWFNFFAGFAYVAAGVGLWNARPWATAFALGLAVLTALVFAAFGVYAGSGGAYEPRTVAAMAVRTALWTFIAALAWLAGRSIEQRAT